MTKRTCLYCGTVFEDSFSFFMCSTCKQTKAMTKAIEEQNELIRQQQRYTAPVYQPVYVPNTPLPPTPPPTPEEIQERKRIFRLHALFRFLFVISPVVLAIVFWFITSGWFTFISFLSIPFIMKFLYDRHWFWQVEHSDYLFRDRGRVRP